MRTGKIALNTFKTFICNQTYLNLPRKVQVGDGVASTQATSSGVAGVLGTLSVAHTCGKLLGCRLHFLAIGPLTF